MCPRRSHTIIVIRRDPGPTALRVVWPPIYVAASCVGHDLFINHFLQICKQALSLTSTQL